MFLKPLTDDVSLDSLSGGFHEFRLGMDDLTEDVPPLGVEFCRQILKCLFFRLLSARLALLLELWVPIVLSDRSNDITRTILHTRRIHRHLKLL